MQLKNTLPTIFIMIGIPGSGKSTYAEDLSKQFNASIHSSDLIRKDLTGNEANLNNDKEVFKLLNKQIVEDLNNGKSTIYDATNLSVKKRIAIFNLIKNIECNKVAVFINTELSECHKRNNSREKKVPAFVVGRLSKCLEPPTIDEGFDDIIIY